MLLMAPFNINCFPILEFLELEKLKEENLLVCCVVAPGGNGLFHVEGEESTGQRWGEASEKGDVFEIDKLVKIFSECRCQKNAEVYLIFDVSIVFQYSYIHWRLLYELQYSFPMQINQKGKKFATDGVELVAEDANVFTFICYSEWSEYNIISTYLASFHFIIHCICYWHMAPHTNYFLVSR